MRLQSVPPRRSLIHSSELYRLISSILLLICRTWSRINVIYGDLTKKTVVGPLKRLKVIKEAFGDTFARLPATCHLHTIMGSALSSSDNNDSSQIDIEDLEQQVVETRLIMLKFLPRELVDMVLDEAEYWPRLSIGRMAEEVTVRADPRDDFNSRSCCLITEPLPFPGQPSETKRPRQIQKLIFTTRSRDQGWGGPTKVELEQSGV